MKETRFEGSQAYYLSGSLPEELSSKCPRCRKERSCEELVSEDGVHCPCGKIASITIVEDTGFISWISGLEKGRIKVSSLPELPSELRERLKEEYGLSEEVSEKLSTVKERAMLFEELSSEVDPSVSSTFVADTLARELKIRELEISDFRREGIESVLKDYHEGKITEDSVDSVVREALDKDKKVCEVYDREEYEKKGEEKLREICLEVIEEEDDAVEDYLDGEEDSVNYLIGMVKKKTDGTADAQKAREFLVEMIEDSN